MEAHNQHIIQSFQLLNKLKLLFQKDNSSQFIKIFYLNKYLCSIFMQIDYILFNSCTNPCSLNNIIHIINRLTMSTNQRKEQLKKFLHKFDEVPINFSELNRPIGQMPMQQFLITYFGMSFIQGYRIVEKINDNIFVMSLMEYQNGGNLGFMGSQGTRRQLEGHRKHGIFRIVCVEFNQKINQDREHRLQVYRDIKQIIDFFCTNQCTQNDQNCTSKQNNSNSNKNNQKWLTPQNCPGIEVHFLFAYNFLYSSIKYESLIKNQKLTIQKFYNRYYGFGKKSDRNQQRQNFGLKVLDQRQQGTKLHEMVELLIKGSGVVRNNQYMNKQVLHQAKFSYKLTKIINSICLIVGREMIQGGYVTISSEKWMRKFTCKRFKKFDLLLRNQKKVCIIDWKFSRVNADQKIATQVFAQKNLQYFRLARKQYNAEVQLKFYCFHQSSTDHHHKFTSATYNYSIEQIQIKDKQLHVNENNQIQIESSDSDNGVSTLHGRITSNIQGSSASANGKGSEANGGSFLKNFKNLEKNNIFGRLGDKSQSKQKSKQKNNNQYSAVIYEKKNQTISYTIQLQPNNKKNQSAKNSSKSKQKQRNKNKNNPLCSQKPTIKTKNKKDFEIQGIVNDLEQEDVELLLPDKKNDTNNAQILAESSQECVCISDGNKQNQTQIQRNKRIREQLFKQFQKQMQLQAKKNKKKNKSKSKSKKSQSKQRKKSKSKPKTQTINLTHKQNTTNENLFQITCISDEQEQQPIQISVDQEQEGLINLPPSSLLLVHNQIKSKQNGGQGDGVRQIHFMHINSNSISNIENNRNVNGTQIKNPKNKVKQDKILYRMNKISEYQQFEQRIKQLQQTRQKDPCIINIQQQEKQPPSHSKNKTRNKNTNKQPSQQSKLTNRMQPNSKGKRIQQCVIIDLD